MTNFHYNCFFFGIIFWGSIFYKYKFLNKNKDLKIENAIAIINNFQLIFFINLSFVLFGLDKDGFMFVDSFDEAGKINYILGFSIYLSLVYNLFDILFQIYNKKFVFVIHHLSLLPFLTGYLYGGYYLKLQIIYAFLEMSSMSYNLRQLFPILKNFHKFFYVIIRIICTPLLIKYFLEEFWNIPLYLNLMTSLSIILLTIFNIISIKLSLNSIKAI
jgi:hypothetical protein